MALAPSFSYLHVSSVRGIISVAHDASRGNTIQFQDRAP